MNAELARVARWLGQVSCTQPPCEGLLFDRARGVHLARAPGRLDAMGGFADYSGSLTLELPLREAAYVAVQRRPEPWVRVVTLGQGRAPLDEARSAAFPLGELRELGDYAGAQAYFRRCPHASWAAYVVGVLLVLRGELGYELDAGVDICVISQVPEGKGVSSSAALEVATLYGACAAFGIDVDPVRAALLCQRVENLIVGAACGVMDQMTSSCGVEGRLMPILCQPATLEPSVALPPGLSLWGIDSGVRHEVGGADYTQVRVAAFMGYRIIAERLGLPVRPGPGSGQVTIHDEIHAGYLANVALESFERDHRESLPDRMLGGDYLRRWQGIGDPITRVAADVVYPVRAATAHPIHEHWRAGEFRRLLLASSEPAASAGGGRREVARRLGALMYASHESYSACGLGASGTDRLVELVRELGPEQGLYGAKITGGGCGGTVAVLADAGASDAVAAVARRRAEDLGYMPHVFRGSSPGAAAFGARELVWREGSWQLGAPRQRR